MIANPQFPRALWPIGTVKAVQAGADNKVRAAKIQVKDRTYIQPVVRLIKLPSLPELLWVLAQDANLQAHLGVAVLNWGPVI